MHTALGAKMVDFAGYAMPVQYTSIIEEHLAVRNSVGVFDVSHMGEFTVEGKDALAFLQRVTINDVSKLFPGRIHYSALCYEDGGIVDDLLVYQRAKEKYLLVVNAGNLTKDWEWLNKQLSGSVVLADRSDETALLAVQGPNSLPLLQKLTSADLSLVPYYHFIEGQIAGIPMIISRTGYTGELGFELYFQADSSKAQSVWNAIFDAGMEFNVLPVGLGARDTLRLEMGFCLYGNDIDAATNPLEAGLGWITKLNKKDFIGKNALLKAKKEGLRRRLIGLTLPDKAIARHGYPVLQGGVQVGTVTSGTFSPSLQKAIAMASIDSKILPGEEHLEISIRGKNVPAAVTAIPFLKK
jgi:aminomethyltransferase